MILKVIYEIIDFPRKPRASGDDPHRVAVGDGAER